MCEVMRLFVAVVHRFPMQEVEEAEAFQQKGFKGCIHGRTGTERQLLLMDLETLDKLQLAPGVIKENVTTRGLDLQALRSGQRLRLGESLVELSEPCVPCSRMDEIRQGLKEALRGQRGWLCRVLEPGKVRRGDRIEVVEANREAHKVAD